MSRNCNLIIEFYEFPWQKKFINTNNNLQSRNRDLVFSRKTVNFYRALRDRFLFRSLWCVAWNYSYSSYIHMYIFRWRERSVNYSRGFFCRIWQSWSKCFEYIYFNNPLRDNGMVAQKLLFKNVEFKFLLLLSYLILRMLKNRCILLSWFIKRLMYNVRFPAVNLQ